MIIPSIDLMGGKAVQLRQGSERMLERDDPLALAREFDRYGETAVIDLDAAMGQGNNLPTIRDILRTTDGRVGGGINTVQKAKELVSLGATKVIIGSRAFENDRLNLDFLARVADAIGKERIIVAVDAWEGEIVTKAWKHRTGLKLLDTLEGLEGLASELLFTCVEREGCMQGTDMATIRRVKDLTRLQLTVAGGITTMDEVRELSRIGTNVQLGMALYTNKLRLDETFIESLDWEKCGGLIPTVTQDDRGRILMLGFSNKDSLRRSFDTGKMCYFSRTRGNLWTKGETSGNFQRFVRVRTDCDMDAVLATVEQKGWACHGGTYSCFGDKTFTLHDLESVVKERLTTSPVMSGSYTATLSKEKAGEKMMEEVRWLVEAADDQSTVYEAADVLYFLTVLLARKGISIEDVFRELERRRHI